MGDVDAIERIQAGSASLREADVTKYQTGVRTILDRQAVFRPLSMPPPPFPLEGEPGELDDFRLRELRVFQRDVQTIEFLNAKRLSGCLFAARTIHDLLKRYPGNERLETDADAICNLLLSVWRVDVEPTTLAASDARDYVVRFTRDFRALPRAWRGR